MESVGCLSKHGRKRKVREILEALKERLEKEMPSGRCFLVVVYKKRKKKVRMRIASNVDRLEQYRMASDFLNLAERRVNECDDRAA